MNAPLLKPWAYGPLEVLAHAEMHYRAAEDVDRRIALIGFDNAIEVAITTYLSLHPIQRGNRQYTKGSVEIWMANFHSKADFFFNECQLRSIVAKATKDELIWFHDVRNGQYHHGGAAIPQRRELEGVRAAAIEIFGVLFERSDVEALLDRHLAEVGPSPAPPRTAVQDKLIDSTYPMVDICGEPEYVSDVLYALDPNRYRDVAIGLREGADGSTDHSGEGGGAA